MATTTVAQATTVIKNPLGNHWPAGSSLPPKWEMSNGNPYKRSEVDRDWYVYCKPLDQEVVQADIYSPQGILHTIILPIDVYYERAESLLHYFATKSKYDDYIPE